MAKKHRVAVLGLGHWYSAYGLGRALRDSSTAELVAAAWSDKAQLDDFVRTFGVTGYASYEELLAKEQVDIVHIAAPVSQIRDLTLLTRIDSLMPGTPGRNDEIARTTRSMRTPRFDAW